MAAPSGKFWSPIPMARATARPGAAAGVLGGHGEGQPHRHPLRDVVQGDGQYDHGGAAQMGGQPFRIAAADVEMGGEPVQDHEESPPSRNPPPTGRAGTAPSPPPFP